MDPITYSNKGAFLTRMAIAGIEYMTGRLTLIREYGHVLQLHDQSPDKPFFDHAIDRLNVTVDYPLNGPDIIPRTGSLLVVCNHPFGILDGLLINHILYKARPDYKILTNEVLLKAERMRDWLIAVDDSNTPEGRSKNKAAIRESMTLLKHGGCICIFPAGRLARPQSWSAKPTEWEWKPLVGHLALKAGPLHILPVYFEGENSALFKAASYTKQFTVTRSLVIHELLNKRSANIHVRIGNPFPAQDIVSFSHAADAETASLYLRQKTLELAGR